MLFYYDSYSENNDILILTSSKDPDQAAYVSKGFLVHEQGADPLHDFKEGFTLSIYKENNP